MKTLFRMFYLQITLLVGMITLVTSEEYPYSRIGNYYQAIEDEDEEDLEGAVLCDDKQLVIYLAHLQVINPESIISIATVGEIDAHCRAVEDSLNSINKYFKICEPKNEKELHKSLVKGVTTLHEKLCKSSSYRTELIKYASCYSQLHGQYSKCSGPEDWSENSSPEFICKTYEGIANCFYDKTEKECGTAEAKTLQKLIEQVITSIIKVKCPTEEKHINNHTAELRETPPLSSHAYNQLFFYIPLVVLLPIILLIIVNYTRKKFFSHKSEEKESLTKIKTMERQK